MERKGSIVNTAVREMREETGLTVRSPRLCGTKQFPVENGRYLVLLFETENFTGEFCSSGEGAAGADFPEKAFPVSHRGGSGNASGCDASAGPDRISVCPGRRQLAGIAEAAQCTL